jgi:hypothetical protein
MAKPDPFEDMDEDELIEEVIIPFLLTQLVSPPQARVLQRLVSSSLSKNDQKMGMEEEGSGLSYS